jgi:aryl-alcohol dehydrogenase-like predicted oxidoreductase
MKVSVVGFPGLALTKIDQEKCTAALHKAFDRGLNYYDVAPNYGNGDAEIKMGVGLRGLDRSQYFLSCKTHKGDKAGAQFELDRSLERLKTDHFDLYQLHHLVTPGEVKQAFGVEGAMEAVLKAKEQGKLKYVGFSGRICRLAVNWPDYQSRFRQEAVDAHRTTYSGPFGRGQRDSLAAKVGRFASALEP